MYEIKETYKDWNDDEQTESFLFNLSTADLIKLEMSEEGGLIENLQEAVKLKDARKIIYFVGKLIDTSYGVKSSNGRYFWKADTEPNVLKEFKATVAYSQIYTKLCTNLDYADKFINGLIPKDLADKVTNMSEEEKQKILEEANNLTVIQQKDKDNVVPINR